MTDIKIGTLLKYYGFDSSEEALGIVLLVEEAEGIGNGWVNIHWADEHGIRYHDACDVQQSLDEGTWDIVAHA